MSAIDSVPTPSSVPNELNYSEPINAIPPGFRTVNFRQVNYNTIPSPTPGGTEIQINIPQIPNAFIDPSTTYLNVKVRISGRIAVQNLAVTPFNTAETVRINARRQLLLAYLNATGWGLFQRYQVYANNSILIEDIDEIGYLAHMLSAATRSSATLTTADLTGDSENGVLPGHRFCAITNCVNIQAANAANAQPPTIAGFAPDATSLLKRSLVTHLSETAIGNDKSQFFSVAGEPMPPLREYELIHDDDGGQSWAYLARVGEGNAAVTYNAVPFNHEFDLCLPLLGILGSNNEKLYPCMYPTQIRLITESLGNILNLPTQFIDVTQTITSMEFCCNYLRLDSGAMATILSSLPMPGVMPMRCTSFVHSSSSLPRGTQGSAQVLVSTRRASMKALFMGFSSNGHNLDDNNAPALRLGFGAKNQRTTFTEGTKFNSINPSLGQNTYLTVNGVFYPQQMLNPVSKPLDCLQQFLQTLNMTQSSTLRPSIRLHDYLRIDYGGRGSQFYNPPAVVDRSESAYDQNHTSNVAAANVIQSVYDNLPLSGILPNIGRNQFYLAIDTEHFGKRGFLSGVSTLGGSVFMNLNIAHPLAADYIFRMFNFHDIMLAFNMGTGQVEVKI